MCKLLTLLTPVVLPHAWWPGPVGCLFQHCGVGEKCQPDLRLHSVHFYNFKLYPEKESSCQKDWFTCKAYQMHIKNTASPEYCHYLQKNGKGISVILLFLKVENTCHSHFPQISSFFSTVKTHFGSKMLLTNTVSSKSWDVDVHSCFKNCSEH